VRRTLNLAPSSCTTSTCVDQHRLESAYKPCTQRRTIQAGGHGMRAGMPTRAPHCCAGAYVGAPHYTCVSCRRAAQPWAWYASEARLPARCRRAGRQRCRIPTPCAAMRHDGAVTQAERAGVSAASQSCPGSRCPPAAPLHPPPCWRAARACTQTAAPCTAPPRPAG